MWAEGDNASKRPVGGSAGTGFPLLSNTGFPLESSSTSSGDPSQWLFDCGTPLMAPIVPGAKGAYQAGRYTGPIGSPVNVPSSRFVSSIRPSVVNPFLLRE